MTRSGWLFVVAVVCFVLLLIFAVFGVDVDRKVTDGLFYGGLALFAAGHVPSK